MKQPFQRVSGCLESFLLLLRPCVCACVCAQAIYASVLPGELMRGYMSHFPTFPSWLGKNSSTGKHSRVVQELTSHMGLR